MTIATNFFTLDNKSGVNLNYVQTSLTTTNLDYPAPSAKPGDRIQSLDGGEWMLVRASATITAFNMVAIDPTFQAANITQAIVSGSALCYLFGVAEFQPNQLGATVSVGNASGGVANPGDYFWAAMKLAAGGQLNVISTAAKGALLYVSTTPGVLTTSASVAPILGLATVTTAATAIVSQLEYIQQTYLTVGAVTA
jgi:hypothetical protein